MLEPAESLLLFIQNEKKLHQEGDKMKRRSSPSALDAKDTSSCSNNYSDLVETIKWRYFRRRIIFGIAFLSYTVFVSILVATVAKNRGCNNDKSGVTLPLSDETLSKFRPGFKPKEKALLLETLDATISMLNEFKVVHFLFAGSLLGYYRHNARMIDWDDDLDIALLCDQISTYQFTIDFGKALQKLASERYGSSIGVDWSPGQRMIRVFPTDNETTVLNVYESGEYRWPFIDLLVFEMYTTPKNEPVFDSPEKIIASGLTANLLVDLQIEPYVYPFDLIFPLDEVEFEVTKVRVNVPRNPLAILQINYGNWYDCISNKFDHRDRIWLEPRKVPCSLLSPYYELSNLP